MSNARVFAWGWMFSMVLVMVIDMFGWGTPSGFISMIKETMLGLTFGMAAVAVFGDRSRGESK